MTTALVALTTAIAAGGIGHLIKSWLDSAADHRRLVQSALIDLHQLVTSAELLWPQYEPMQVRPTAPFDLVHEPSGCLWTAPFVTVEQYCRTSNDMQLQRYLMIFMDNWRIVDFASRALDAVHHRLTNHETWGDLSSVPLQRDLEDYIAYRTVIRSSLGRCLQHGSEACARLIESTHGFLFEQNARAATEAFMNDELGCSRRNLRARADHYADEPDTVWQPAPALPAQR